MLSSRAIEQPLVSTARHTAANARRMRFLFGGRRGPSMATRGRRAQHYDASTRRHRTILLARPPCGHEHRASSFGVRERAGRGSGRRLDALLLRARPVYGLAPFPPDAAWLAIRST